MSVLKKHLTLTVEEYLAGEVQSEVKHEYVNGYVYAMVGASREHSLVGRAALFCPTLWRLKHRKRRARNGMCPTYKTTKL